MKKASSPVWRFFERVIEQNRCVAVVCKLCENQYKFFGNTTNLRVHLTNKHPIQWELSESGNLDDSSYPIIAAVSKTENVSSRKKKYTTRSTEKNVDILKHNSDSDQDDEDDDVTTMNMVRQMHGDENSAEEWLEEDPYQITHIETFEPKPKRRRVKYHKIKREVQSPTDSPGYYIAPKPEKIYQREEPLVRKDEYSVFGEYVANKLRKLRTPRTRGNLQQLITTLLWQAEYGMYDSAEAVKRVLMISVTPEQEQEVANAVTVDFDQPAMETVIDTTELSHSNEELVTE